MRTIDDPAGVIQQVHLELYRDNIEGALRLLHAAEAAHPHPRYLALENKIVRSLKRLDTLDDYAQACERFYRREKGGLSLKLLEREVLAAKAARALDAGRGEGRITLTLAARHPGIRVAGIEASSTNVRLARRMNRFGNAAFHLGLIEEAPMRFPAGAFDVAYADSGLEHVANVDIAVKAILETVRPGGRFCFVVPMNEFATTGPLPEPPLEDAAGHVRVFTEDDLCTRFGHDGHFSLVKLPGDLPTKYPPHLVPRELGAFFVAVSRPA